MNQQTTPTSGANGHVPLHDLFALTDEQILEIEPETQDVTASEHVAQGNSPAPVSSNATPTSQAGVQTQTATTQTAQAGLPVLLDPPAWLAETMNDPQRGAEARALWDGAQRAEREAASYREVFAKPEEARSAAERARQLDDIDRAYFAGDASQRAQLAAMMMREDPAAFREMVFEGLRALEATGHEPRARSVADALSRSGNTSQNSAGAAGTTLASPLASAGAASKGDALRHDPGQAGPANATQANTLAQQQHDSSQNTQLAAYAAFEKAANDDLERSVGGAIERTLEQALPATGRADGAALKQRMSAAVRQDVEKALQGDRQLGEQVAQILSPRRLDNETRAQIVRLISERAQQLVPTAAKRALSDWTQAALSAHRGKSSRSDAASRADITPALARGTSPAGSSEKNGQRSRDDKNRGLSSSAATRSSRVDYRKLSDEQILEL